MIEDIRNEFIQISKNYENKTGYNYWEEHVIYVVKIAVSLAERIGADKEIVEISAILHDIAKPLEVRMKEEHNVVGGDIAYEMLTKINYDENKIEKVRNCIIKHNGKVDLDSLTKEEWCVRNADILSMLNNLTIFYYLAYCDGRSYKDGKEYVKKMITNKFSKLDSTLKEEYKKDFDILFNSI